MKDTRFTILRNSYKSEYPSFYVWCKNQGFKFFHLGCGFSDEISSEDFFASVKKGSIIAFNIGSIITFNTVEPEYFNKMQQNLSKYSLVLKKAKNKMYKDYYLENTYVVDTQTITKRANK